MNNWIYKKFIYKPSYEDQLADLNIAYVNGKNLVASIDKFQDEMLGEG
tara:strand:+ start:67 stop:210 length:144 start_codon:yes stop_codon:yes gene_type:complete